MDPSLVKDLDKFKKTSIATQFIPKLEKTDSFLRSSDSDDGRVMRPNKPAKFANDAEMCGGSTYRFGVLTKIVRYMRERHQCGNIQPLTLEEILDETHQLNTGQSVKNWLSSEALRNNSKIEVVTDIPTFLYKAVYNIKNGKDLVYLLKKHYQKGLGGVWLEDVKESLAQYEKILKKRAAEITIITRPNDKRKILFYNDQSLNFEIDEEYRQLWRSVNVETMDEIKIDEYLEKQGIQLMRSMAPKYPIVKRRKAKSRAQYRKPRDNEHLADVLEDYENTTVIQKGIDLMQVTGVQK